MDSATCAYYAEHAAEVAGRYEQVPSPLAGHFATAFAAGSRVLDVGCGSGRDLTALRAAGFDAFGVEPVDALRAQAFRLHPELGGRIATGALPAVGVPFGGDFDGVLCSAVLMHLPQAELFDAAFALRALLRPHGRLLVSVPLSRGETLQHDRDANGRLFTPLVPEALQLLFERIGLQLIGRWDSDDALQRDGTRWSTLLFELRGAGALRAADQIEGILNRDRKVATYKLALFRALAEIAMQEPHAVHWRAGGVVAVPLQRIAERWLLYSWPIIAAGHVPQSQDEGAGSRNPLRIRASLTALIDAYRHAGEYGGLSAWHLDRMAGRMTAEVRARLHAALRDIAVAIRTGPVAYSGGALDTGRVFGWDAGLKAVTLSTEMWRELSLLAHWIVDAVIVRWAALTARFAQRQGLSAGAVLPLLLARPAPERATALARQIYRDSGIGHCVWSGKALARGFEADHIIPFALWGNNALWNLVPVAPAVNRAKSDRLPAADLLASRRPEILGAWQVARCAVPDAFDRDACSLLGHRLGRAEQGLRDLFDVLRESIEITALQRGVARWEP